MRALIHRALWLLIGLQASWGRAAVDLCQYHLSAINERCPHSFGSAIGLPNPNCEKHARETIATCSSSIDAAQKDMKEAPNDEKYRAAADRYGKALIAMGRLRTMDQPDIRRMQPILDQALRPRERWLAESLPPSKRGESHVQTDKSKEEPKPDGIAEKVGKQIGEGQRKGGETAKETHDLLAEEEAESKAKAEEADRQRREKEAAEIKVEMDKRSDFAKKAEDRTGDALDDSKDAAEKWKNGGSGSDSEGGPENDKNDPSPSGKNSGNRSSGGGSNSGGSMGGTGGQAQAMTSGRRSFGGDAANPKTGQDLLLASLGGYKSAFAGAGFKMGRGETGDHLVLRSDGSPASAAEVEGLKKLIAAEPQALQKRPDFFDVLPRERFAALKESYQRKPNAKPFKHVDVPERRDFEWNQSCDKVSGSCNEYSRQSSYRRGEFISPEDLWNISSVLGGKEGEEKVGSSADSAREKLARGPYANLMKNVLGALGGIMNAVKGGGSSSSSSGSSVWGGGGSWSWNWRAREPVEYSDPARTKRGRAGAPGRPADELQEPGKDSRGGLWWLLAAAGAACWGIWAINKRRTIPH